MSYQQALLSSLATDDELLIQGDEISGQFYLLAAQKALIEAAIEKLEETRSKPVADLTAAGGAS